MVLVVEDLIFAAQTFVRVRKIVLHTTVCSLRDLPLPRKLEIVKLLASDDIAAARAFRMEKSSVLNGPTFGWELTLSDRSPSRGRFAIEQEFPSLGFLFRRQGVLGKGRS